LRIALAQLDCVPGQVEANLSRAGEVVDRAGADGADLVVFPELFLSGHCVNDQGGDVTLGLDDERLGGLSLRGERPPAVVVGFTEAAHGAACNSASYLQDGSVTHVHRKVSLVRYVLFEEDKRFSPGRTVQAFDTALGPMAILLCNDAWQPGLAAVAVHAGAEVLVVPSNSADSAFSQFMDLHQTWRDITRFYASLLECFVVFVNRVGGEGGMAFWGGSHVVDPSGRVVAEAPLHEEALLMVDIDLADVHRRRWQVPLLDNPALDVVERDLGLLAGQRRAQLEEYLTKEEA